MATDQRTLLNYVREQRISLRKGEKHATSDSQKCAYSRPASPDQYMGCVAVFVKVCCPLH